jgi:ribosomal protein S27AE
MAAFESWFEENKHYLASIPAPYNAYKVVWNAAAKPVEEKFTSTNSKSMPCPECGSLNTHVEGYHCADCNIPWLV